VLAVHPQRKLSGGRRWIGDIRQKPGQVLFIESAGPIDGIGPFPSRTTVLIRSDGAPLSDCKPAAPEPWHPSHSRVQIVRPCCSDFLLR